MASSLLILGGARSGKSRFALTQHAGDRRLAFVATATASDADMAARIARHRAERPRHWIIVEEPLDLTARLSDLEGKVDAAIVDCLTLWVANRLERGESDETILHAGQALTKLIAGCRYDLTLVSNEVGAGVHPPTPAGLRFRDLLGLVNQQVAAACTRVVLMVAGLPLPIKTPPPQGYDFAVQSP